MVVRNFNERSTVVGSYSTYNPVTKITNNYNSSHSEGIQGSIDSVGHPKPYVVGGNFNLVKNDVRAPRVKSGKWSFATEVYTFSNYGMNGPILPSAATTLVFDTLNDVLARSNPSKPIVDVPVFIGELRELPELFLIRGRKLLDLLAEGNLSYQFGWKPFISDLMGLLDFQSHLDTRAAYLSKLYQKGGMSFTTKKDKSEYETPWSYLSSNMSAWCWGEEKSYARTERWYSVKWVPEEDVRNHIRPLSEIRQKAFRSMLGLEVSLSSAWELLPWSWLIDWFSDAGSYLTARRNAAGFVPGQCFTMTHSYRIRWRRPTTWSARPNWPEKPVFVTGYVSEESKVRTLGSVSPVTIRVPILSFRQWGILASIGWLRR